jgi:hypothetical protein
MLDSLFQPQEQVQHLYPTKTKGYFCLTDDQLAARAVLNGPGTHKCLVGGSRSGKTSLIVRNIIRRALQAPSSRHLMVRFRGNAVRSSVWLDTFPKVLRLAFPGVKTTPHRMDGFEEFDNGAQVWFGGLDEADRVEKILGQEYATIYAGECSQIPYSSIMVLRTRLAQPGTGLKLKGYYDLNPTSLRHWTNVEFGEHRSPITGLPLVDPHNYQRAFLNPEGNAENLDPSYLESLRNMPAAYRQRFYEGKYVVDVDGALWTLDTLELCRDERVEPDAGGRKLSEFTRVVVGVDPSGASGKEDKKSDEIGIVVVGKRSNGTAVVLEDATMKGKPSDWGRAAVAMFRKWHADRIVAEANFGGEMVRSTIQATGSVPVELVNATRGKHVRAEPVSALYDEQKITHAGRFNDLEGQLCLFSKFGYKGDTSPDRADALVWAVTDLMLGEQSTYTLMNVR